jgi:tetratricopeptide (TPR) repeat protein
LDKIQNRNARRILIDYYRNAGDSVQAEVEAVRADADFPETDFGKKGFDLAEQGRFSDAVPYLRRALSYNPLYSDAYVNLGVCYVGMNKLDSALVLVEISNALNPYNTRTLANLGTIHMRLKQPAKAEGYFREALRIDSLEVNAIGGLASVYVSLKRYEESMQYLRHMHRLQDIGANYFKQAGDAYWADGATTYAVQAYQMAIAKGLDSSQIGLLQDRFPELSQ